MKMQYKAKKLDGQETSDVWVFGNAILLYGDGCLLSDGQLHANNGDDYKVKGCYVDPDTICLSIGYEDRNDDPIYSDDKIEFKANYTPFDKPAGWMIGVIKFDGMFRWWIKVGDLEYDLVNETDEGPYTWEVVGNIHDK